MHARTLARLLASSAVVPDPARDEIDSRTMYRPSSVDGGISPVRSRLLHLLVLAALSAGFALASADSAPAALSWASEAGTEATQATQTNCVPCFFVAIVVEGNGHVSGVSPGSPEAGRIECPPQTVDGQPYDCSYYYIWLDGDPTVILTATPNSGVFSGWEPGDATSIGCPQLGPGPNQCTLNLENTPLGTCIKAVFSDPGGPFGACETVPQNPCTLPNPPPTCGIGPPVQPPTGGGGGGGTGVPSWTAACTIVGSAGPDVLRGTSGRNVICGRGGNDRIYGNGGNDLLRGQGGNDKLYGGAGIDRLDGGLGTDTLNGNAGKDQERGGGGADTFYAKDGVRDALVGGPGRDRARPDRVDSLSSIERRF